MNDEVVAIMLKQSQSSNLKNPRGFFDKNASDWDIHQDDNRFLMKKPTSEKRIYIKFKITVNMMAELKERLQWINYRDPWQL